MCMLFVFQSCEYCGIVVHNACGRYAAHDCRPLAVHSDFQPAHDWKPAGVILPLIQVSLMVWPAWMMSAHVYADQILSVKWNDSCLVWTMSNVCQLVLGGSCLPSWEPKLKSYVYVYMFMQSITAIFLCHHVCYQMEDVQGGVRSPSAALSHHTRPPWSSLKASEGAVRELLLTELCLFCQQPCEVGLFAVEPVWCCTCW
jgi:hypothetical protein